MTIFWAIFWLLFVFCGPIIYGISMYIRQSFKHRERMQERRNEELRLQIQLEQMRNTHAGRPNVPSQSDVLPKDASWEEQIQAPYEMGYQQMNQQQ